MSKELVRGERLDAYKLFGKNMGKQDIEDTFSIDESVPGPNVENNTDKDDKIHSLQQDLLPQMSNALKNEEYDLYEELAKRYNKYNKQYKDENRGSNALNEIARLGDEEKISVSKYKNKKSNDRTRDIVNSEGASNNTSNILGTERSASTQLRLYKQGKEIASANEAVKRLRDRYERARAVLDKYKSAIPDENGSIVSADQPLYSNVVNKVPQDRAITQQQALVDKIGAELDEAVSVREALPYQGEQFKNKSLQDKDYSARERYAGAKAYLKEARRTRDDAAKGAREAIARTKLDVKLGRLGRMEHNLAPGGISKRTAEDLRVDNMLDAMFHYTKSSLNEEEAKQGLVLDKSEDEFNKRLKAQQDAYKERTGKGIDPLDSSYNRIKADSVGLRANNAAVKVMRNTAEKMIAERLLEQAPEQVEVIRGIIEKQNKDGKYDTLINGLDENKVEYAPGEKMLVNAYNYLSGFEGDKGSQQRNVFYGIFNNEMNRIVAIVEKALNSSEVDAAREYASILSKEARTEAKASEVHPTGVDRVATVYYHPSRSGFDYGIEVSTKGGSEGATGKYLGRVVSDVEGNKWLQVYSAIPRSDVEVADVKDKHRGKVGAKDAIWVESHQANDAEDPVFFTQIKDGTDVKQAIEKAKMYLESNYGQITGKYTARAQAIKDTYKDMAGKAEGTNFTDFIESEGIDPTDGSPRNLQRVLNYLRKMHDDMGLMVDQNTHKIYRIDNAPADAVDWWDTYHNAKLAYIQETRNAQKSRVFKPDNPMSRAIRALVTKRSYGQGAVDYSSDKAKEKTKAAEEAQLKGYKTSKKQQGEIEAENIKKLKDDPLKAAFFAQYGK